MEIHCPGLFTWALPVLESGVYAWFGVLIPAGEEAATGYTVWRFTSGVASGHRSVLAEEASGRIGEGDLDLGEWGQ